MCAGADCRTRSMPQKAAAEMLGVPSSTLSDVFHRLIGRARQPHKIRGLKTIGIDEISYAKGHKYATVVCDLGRSCVVWVGRGKARETIDQFFRLLSPYQKAHVRWACCDMSEAFIGAIQQHCPNAQLVLDRFHVVKALLSTTPSTKCARNNGARRRWRNARRSRACAGSCIVTPPTDLGRIP